MNRMSYKQKIHEGFPERGFCAGVIARQRERDWRGDEISAGCRPIFGEGSDLIRLCRWFGQPDYDEEA
jgi:hypothetical protein